MPLALGMGEPVVPKTSHSPNQAGPGAIASVSVGSMSAYTLRRCLQACKGSDTTFFYSNRPCPDLAWAGVN